MTEVKRVYYNKLVRDNIPDKIASNNEECEVRQITDADELQQELLKKVKEEADAVANSNTREEFIDEYCDLQLLLETVLQKLNVAEAELEEVKKKNLAKKGAYTKGYFLHWSSAGSYRSNESVQGVTGKKE